MRVIVAGLVPREEAAFGMFLGRSLPGWSWRSAVVGCDAVLPEAELVVLDLAGLKLTHWSEATQAELLRLLRGMPAVLLCSAFERSWDVLQRDATNPFRLFWLTRPYTTERLRQVLVDAAASAARPASPHPTPVTGARLAADRPRAKPMTTPTPAPKPTPTSSVGPAAGPVVAVVESGLSVGEFQARLADLPETQRRVFLRRLSEMLSLERPFEARFTAQNSVIFNPVELWVASNTPMLVIEKVGRSDALASAITMLEINPEEAEEKAYLRGMSLRELDTFLFDLLAATQNSQASHGKAG